MTRLNSVKKSCFYKNGTSNSTVEIVIPISDSFAFIKSFKSAKIRSELTVYSHRTWKAKSTMISIEKKEYSIPRNQQQKFMI